MTPFSSCIVFLWLLLIIWYDFWSDSSSKNSDRNKEPLQVPKAQLCNLTSKRVQWVLWCFMAFTPQSLASLEMQIMWTWIRQSARSCPQHVKETFSMLCWTLLMTLNHPKSLRTRTLGDCCKKVTWLTWAVSLANDRTIYSTAIMPRIFPWCLMHPKSTLLWESEDVRGRLYWHCTGCSKLWQWYNVDQCGTWWIILVHLGTSYSQRHEAKSCNGCWTTRVISNVSNYRCHAHELLNLWKHHLHQTAYSTLAASRTKMNQCLHALHGCIVLLTFAICLCICQSIFTVSVEPRNAHRLIDTLIILPAGSPSPERRPQPTRPSSSAHTGARRARRIRIFVRKIMTSCLIIV